MAKDEPWMDDRQKDSVLNRGVYDPRPTQNRIPAAKPANVGSSISGSLGTPYTPKIDTSVTEAEIRASNAKLPIQAAAQPKLTPEQAETIALIDSQTGVFNLRYVSRQLAFEVERAKYFNRTVSVLIVTIDKCSSIGLEYGSMALDNVLEAATAVLVGAIRPFDLVGRFSEQQLIVVCSEIERKELTTMAQTICDVCSKLEVKYQWKSFNFTVSIGAAVSSVEAEDPESLMALAAARATAASDKGGNAICLAS